MLADLLLACGASAAPDSGCRNPPLGTICDEDSAARIASDGEIAKFRFEGPLLEGHEPAIPVSEAQRKRDLRHVDEGSFDIDLVPRLRHLRRFLKVD